MRRYHNYNNVNIKNLITKKIIDLIFFQPIVIIESQPSSSAQTSVEGSHGNLSCRPKDFLTNVISINNQVRNGVIMIIVKSCQNSKKNGTQILIKVIFLPLRFQECHPFPRLALYHQLIQPLLVLLHSNWPLHLSSWLHRCQPSPTLPRPLLIPQPRNCQVPKMVNRFQFVHHQVKYQTKGIWTKQKKKFIFRLHYSWISYHFDFTLRFSSWCGRVSFCCHLFANDAVFNYALFKWGKAWHLQDKHQDNVSQCRRK